MKGTDNSIAFLHVLHDSSIPSSNNSVVTSLPPLPKSSIERVKYSLSSEAQPPSLQDKTDTKSNGNRNGNSGSVNQEKVA